MEATRNDLTKHDFASAPQFRYLDAGAPGRIGSVETTISRFKGCLSKKDFNHFTTSGVPSYHGVSCKKRALQKSKKIPNDKVKAIN